MTLFDNLRAIAGISRLNDELLYARVAEELTSGVRRDGLWAKALADGSGDETRAKALYIRLRV